MLKRTVGAKKETVIGQEKEQVELAYISASVDKLGDDVTDVDLQNELNSSVGTDKTKVTLNADNTFNVLFKDTKNNYNVNGGEVAKIDPLPNIGAGERAKAKSEYSDGTNTAKIPEGFTVSGIPTEQNIAKGLVIYDIPEGVTVDWEAKTGDWYTVQTLYNQFVWVPVDIPNDFKRYKGYVEYELLNDDTYNRLMEPYVNIQNNYSEEAEYNLMKKSVIGNKGFYVARYEASQGSNGCESKAGKNPWYNIAWGTSMDDIGTSGAVYQATHMYTSDSSITSTLIYGVQWDAIMAWIDPNYKTGSCDTATSFVANSTGKGYYTLDENWNDIEGLEKSVVVTGSNSSYAVNNIYDLAGNVSELTMEALVNSDSDKSRVIRGGGYWDPGFSRTASSRVYQNAYRPDDTIGFRVALYL